MTVIAGDGALVTTPRVAVTPTVVATSSPVVLRSPVSDVQHVERSLSNVSTGQVYPQTAQVYPQTSGEDAESYDVLLLSHLQPCYRSAKELEGDVSMGVTGLG